MTGERLGAGTAVAETDPSLIRKLLEQVERSRGEYIEFLRTLVKTDTTGCHGTGRYGDAGCGKEAAGQGIVREFLEAIGCDTESFEPDNDRMARYPDLNAGGDYTGRPNVVATLHGSGGGRSLILNGHIDTMPVTDRESWTFDPFGADVSGGRLYGRGATDMKGGLAAGMCALKAVRQCGLTLRGDVILQSVVDEEGGGNGTLACVERGCAADGAIVLEPTDLDVVIAGMGWVFYEIEVEGFATHAGSKWKGVNAIEKTLRIVDELRELERMWLMTHKHPYLPGPTVNIGKVCGGESASTVPGRCVVTVGVHYQPSQSDERGYWSTVESEVLAAVRAAATSDSWMREHEPRVTRIQQGTPHEIAADHPLVDTLVRASSRVSARAPEVGGVGYGCDARLLSNLARIPTIVFGPGEPVQAHRRDESIDLEDYVSAVKILALAIVEWCGMREP